MSIPSVLKEKYSFHFTHIRNLDSILKNGLLCTNLKDEQNIAHVNMASESIQARRGQMTVTCKPNGTVHDYVPFYLTAVNPMFLHLLHTKNIDQQDIIFLGMSIMKVLEKNVIFTDASANTAIAPKFYKDPKDLDKLTWSLIDSKKWGNKNKDEMHKRMAEILVYQSVPIKWIDCIVLWNESTKKEVTQIFKDNSLTPPTLSYSPFKGAYTLHYTKFMFKGRGDESLITGPETLIKEYRQLIKNVLDKRILGSEAPYRFKNIADAIKKIENNFCAIPELEGIYKLETENEVHSENVSDHTTNVVLSASPKFGRLKLEEKLNNH